MVLDVSSLKVFICKHDHVVLYLPSCLRLYFEKKLKCDNKMFFYTAAQCHSTFSGRLAVHSSSTHVFLISLGIRIK